MQKLLVSTALAITLTGGAMAQSLSVSSSVSASSSTSISSSTMTMASADISTASDMAPPDDMMSAAAEQAPSVSEIDADALVGSTVTTADNIMIGTAEIVETRADGTMTAIVALGDDLAGAAERVSLGVTTDADGNLVIGFSRASLEAAIAASIAVQS